MAITSVNGLQTYMPGYNPMWVVATSDATAQDNFEYIFDISIEGETFAGGASSVRIKSPTDPTYGSGVCDPSTIVKPYLTGDLGDTIYGFQQCGNSIKKVTVQVGEMYGPSSGITTYPNQDTATMYAFNGSFGFFDIQEYLKSNYVANNVSVNANVQLLTYQPSSGTIVEGYSQWIYVMSQTSGVVKFANINMYNTTGVLSGTAKVINHQYYNTSTTENRMLRFPAGWNVSQISAGDIVSGSLSDFLNTTTNARWEIYFTDSSHNRVTESFYSSWNTSCTTHTVYQLYFKNKLGGYDTFDFTRASQTNTSIKRDKYEKSMGEWKSATSYNMDTTDRFESNFHTEYKDSIKLNSDWITESQSTWLKELLTSDDIRVDAVRSSGSHYLVPVNIVETQYTERKHSTDKIFNISVTFQYSFNETRQGS